MPEEDGTAAEPSSDVDRALSLIALQANCDEGEAEVRLRRRADVLHRTLDDTARFVIDGIVRFDVSPD